jgi:hypothetical protein
MRVEGTVTVGLFLVSAGPRCTVGVRAIFKGPGAVGDRGLFKVP